MRSIQLSGYLLLAGFFFLFSCKGPDFCEEHSDAPTVSGSLTITEGEPLELTNDGTFDEYHWVFPRTVEPSEEGIGKQQTLRFGAVTVADEGQYQTWGSINGCVTGVQTVDVTIEPAIPACSPATNSFTYSGTIGSGSETFTNDQLCLSYDGAAYRFFADNGIVSVNVSWFGLALPESSQSYLTTLMPDNTIFVAVVRTTIPNSGMGPPIYDLPAVEGARVYLVVTDDRRELRLCDVRLQQEGGTMNGVTGSFSFILPVDIKTEC